MEFLLIALCLLAVAANHALGFFALARDVNLKNAFKISSSALGLNKILFTGSGYLLTAYFSRYGNLSATKVMAIFILLEAGFFSIWLVFGFYYGWKLLLEQAPYGLLAAVAIISLIIFFKRSKVAQLFSHLKLHLVEIRGRIFWLILFSVINLLISLFYYQALFAIFDHRADLASVLKVASIALSTGYLSPIPAGLGIKDASFAMLLINQGISASSAVAIAFWDRLISTFFWGSLGIVFSFDMVRAAIVRRLKL